MSIPYVAFLGLLDTLAGQFFNTNEALCTGKDFGGQAHDGVKNFFTVAIVSEELNPGVNAVGVLTDNSAFEEGKESFTFTIYIDPSVSHSADLKKIFSKIVIAHEVCHFAFYYELFIDLGAAPISTVYSQFKNIASGKMEQSITKEKNNTYETIVDEHSAEELIRTWGNYPDSHFAKRHKTKLSYKEFFYRFFGYL
jgi:hypothetical protein